ncbi:hypothetical protein G6F65_021594 [Rhizopus arrhizus]|nr:hypothetical protein G6F65_021594 [Rhizopus arrhizus]
MHPGACEPDRNPFRTSRRAPSGRLPGNPLAAPAHQQTHGLFRLCGGRRGNPDHALTMNDIAPPIRFRTEAEEKARHEGNKLTKRLARETTRALSDYNMIGEGDRVMVCLARRSSSN